MQGLLSSRSSCEQEPYHWYGQYLHQCKKFQIWMAASRSFYVPWSCTREGQGCTIMSLSKEIDIKDSSRKARWTLKVATLKGLVPAQDGPFFYTRYHLSALQNCALLLSTNFQFIFIFKKCTTQFIIELCCAQFFSKILYRYLLTSRTVL